MHYYPFTLVMQVVYHLLVLLSTFAMQIKLKDSEIVLHIIIFLVYIYKWEEKYTRSAFWWV